MLLAIWFNGPVRAQSVNESEPHTTIVIFADHPLTESRWLALMAALYRSMPDAVAESRAIDPEPEFMRGDAVKPGMQIAWLIVVYLHGNCDLSPRLPVDARGKALGWVQRNDGHIEPFIHVDCTRIGQVLRQWAERMSQEQRTVGIDEAMARVILHEWVHIATQSREHGHRGITKAQFTVTDLIPNDTPLIAWLYPK